MKTLLQKVGTMFSRSSSELPSPDSSIAISPSAPLVVPQVIDAKGGFLAGQLLVATPVIDSGCFHKAVIYLFSHSAEGAMGIIINQPLERVGYKALVENLNLSGDAAQEKLTVYFGGPVERARGFVIHSTDYVGQAPMTLQHDVAISTSTKVLEDMAMGHGPRHAALVVGYAGWSAGQLEAEIEANSWITLPATAELVFGTEDDLKWATASKSLGIDMAFFSKTVGHA